MNWKEALKKVYNHFCRVTLLLNLVAWCMVTYCLILWQTEDKNSYNRLPAKNSLELTVWMVAIPGGHILLSTMVVLLLIGQNPGIITHAITSAMGFSLFIVSGVIGVINSLDYWFTGNMKKISILCCVTSVILIFDFIWINKFFRKKKEKGEEQPADKGEEKKADSPKGPQDTAVPT